MLTKSVPLQVDIARVYIFNIFICSDNSAGTPHLQGWIQFDRPYTFVAVTKLHPTADWRPAVAADAANYCMKVGNVYLRKELKKSKQGARADFEEIRECIKNGDRGAQLRLKFPMQCARYGSYITSLIGDIARPPLPDIVLRPWQEHILYDFLGKPPSQRTILFVIDPVGNAGKSTFCDYLHNKLPFVQQFRNGKAIDLAHTVEYPEIALFDFSRCSDDYRPWQLVESVKDGKVFSAKYESTNKFWKRPHVIVFTNSDVEEGAFSIDRIEKLWLSRYPVSPSVVGIRGDGTGQVFDPIIL